MIGFKPAKDFFGSPTPLKVRVLDNTFAGVFSDSTGEARRFLPSAVRNTVNGPVAVNTGDFGASVRNINDAPFANTPIVNIRATQDVPVNFRFNSVHPDGLFSDIDSTNLTWVLRPILLDMPTWINFDPVAKTLSGTPSNFDVGVTEFQLTATDSDGLSVSVPLNLTVANVNDPPQIIDLSSRTIVENERGAIIGKITTFDPDPFDQLAFTVSDNRFVINGETLALRPSASINFELEPQVVVNVTATDNGTPSISTTKSFTLTVIDKNEFFPTLATQDLVIPFVRINNQTIADLDATDEDTQQIVRFRIERDDAGIFEINTDTGVLRLKPGANVTAQTISCSLLPTTMERQLMPGQCSSMHASKFPTCSHPM